MEISNKELVEELRARYPSEPQLLLICEGIARLLEYVSEEPQPEAQVEPGNDYIAHYWTLEGLKEKVFRASSKEEAEEKAEQWLNSTFPLEECVGLDWVELVE